MNTRILVIDDDKNYSVKFCIDALKAGFEVIPCLLTKIVQNGYTIIA